MQPKKTPKNHTTRSKHPHREPEIHMQLGYMQPDDMQLGDMQPVDMQPGNMQLVRIP